MPGPTAERMDAYGQQRLALFSGPEFAEIVPRLPAPARRKLLSRIAELRRDL